MKSLALKPNRSLSIIPKPTNAEITAALVALRVERLKQQVKERDDEIARLKDECSHELTELFKKQASGLNPSLRFGHRACKWVNGKDIYEDRIVGLSASVDLTKLPRALEKKLVRMDELSSTRIVINPTQIRRDVQRGLKGMASPEERTSELLQNQQSRQVLNELLDKLEAA